MICITVLLAISLLAACADVHSGTSMSPRLDSGIRSSSGGARASGGQPGVSSTTRVGPGL